MRNNIGITVHFVSNESQQNAMLHLQTIQRPSHSWKHRNPQFEEIVSYFEITKKTTFQRSCTSVHAWLVSKREALYSKTRYMRPPRLSITAVKTHWFFNQDVFLLLVRQPWRADVNGWNVRRHVATTVDRNARPPPWQELQGVKSAFPHAITTIGNSRRPCWGWPARMRFFVLVCCLALLDILLSRRAFVDI